MVAHTMTDSRHEVIVEYMKTLFNERKKRNGTEFVALLNSKVQIAKNVRVADIVIGMVPRHSGGSDNVSFGEHNVPALVVEVTSTNRSVDLGVKKEEYASAGIPMYWIVDRAKGCANSDAVAAVHVGELRGTRYQFVKYRGSEKISSFYFGRVTADNLLNPPDPGKLATRYATKEKRRLQKAEETAKAEARGRIEAEKTAKAEARSRIEAEKKIVETERKRSRAKARAQKRKAALEQAGIPVSESSSSPSPEKVRQRR